MRCYGGGVARFGGWRRGGLVQRRCSGKLGTWCPGLLVFPPSRWEEFRAKASHRLCRYRQRRRARVVSSLEALAVELRLHPEGLGSPGEIPSFGFPSGRWRRLRRSLLGGIVLESPQRLQAQASPSSVGWMSGQRPRADGVCTSRRRSREPWWATASWGGAVAWLGLGDNLVSLGRRGCGLGRRVSAEAV